MATIKKKTLEEKIREANQTQIISRKGSQEFIWFWDEQKEVYRKLISLLRERYDISGDGKVLTLAAQYLINEIESEAGAEKTDDRPTV